MPAFWIGIITKYFFDEYAKFCSIAVKKSLQYSVKYDIITWYYEQSSATVGTNVLDYKGGFNHEHKSNS